MLIRYKHFFILLAGAWLLCACSASRFLPDETYMLRKVKVVADGKYKDVNTSQMKSYVRQNTNTRWLSAVKGPLAIYSLAGRDSSWVNRILWGMGEAPVVFDTLLARQSCIDMRQALQNMGYLDAQVEIGRAHV